MKWYCTKLIFRIVIDDENVTPQFDESVRLISAESSSDAFAKAREIGRASETSFINFDLVNVAWVFVDVVQLCELDELTDGIEIYSNSIEEEKPEHLILSVKRQAEFLAGMFEQSHI